MKDIKVETIQQYVVLKYIRDNFFVDYIDVEIMDSISLKATDILGQSMVISYKDGQIVILEENKIEFED